MRNTISVVDHIKQKGDVRLRHESFAVENSTNPLTANQIFDDAGSH